MPRLRRLTAREILRFLGSLGFEVARTRGSHVTLVKVAASGERQVLTVPLHRTLKTGLVHAIYRRAARFVPEVDLRRFFFAD